MKKILSLVVSLTAISGICAAVLSLGLFIFGCWRFVPGWLAFWKTDADALQESGEPKHIVLIVALLSVAVVLLLLPAVLLLLDKFIVHTTLDMKTAR